MNKLLSLPRYHPGQMVTVVGMPSYGAMRIMYVKPSSKSGWHYELRADDGGTWVIPQDEIEGPA